MSVAAEAVPPVCPRCHESSDVAVAESCRRRGRTVGALVSLAGLHIGEAVGAGRGHASGCGGGDSRQVGRGWVCVRLRFLLGELAVHRAYMSWRIFGLILSSSSES
jgi:hypothetical protein